MHPRHKHFLFWILTAVSGILVVIFFLVKVDEYKRVEDISLIESALNKVKSVFGGKYKIGLKTYENSDFILNYPAKLSLTESSGKIVLEHQIPYKNSGDCDMKGGSESFNYLTDFKVSFEIFNGTVKQAVLKNSPYMPSENYAGDTLKISPGFIDSYQIGNFSGFAILEGAEGCGRVIYYFPVSDGKVLIVDRANIQALSSIIVKEKRDEVLAVPGVITPEENEKIFGQVLYLSTFRFAE